MAVGGGGAVIRKKDLLLIYKLCLILGPDVGHVENLQLLPKMFLPELLMSFPPDGGEPHWSGICRDVPMMLAHTDQQVD